MTESKDLIDGLAECDSCGIDESVSKITVDKKTGENICIDCLSFERRSYSYKKKSTREKTAEE